MVVAIGGASCTALSRALMSCIQKPTYGFNAKGLDSQAAEPRFPAPISGKDIRTVAKVGRDERLLDLIASMSGFGHTKTRKRIFMIGRRPLDLMPPARVIAGPRALLTSILLVGARATAGDAGDWVSQ
jgi:hypothetical protein